MSLTNRAFRNVFRKPTRTLLVVLALGFSIAAIMSVYSGIIASTDNTNDLIDETIANTESNIAQSKAYIYETEELNELQERLIQVGGGRAGGGPGGGSGFSQTPITSEVIENITSIDYVESVIPVINQRIGEIDDAEREQMMELRSQGAGGTGGVGLDPEVFNSFFDYFIQGVPINSYLDETYSIQPSNMVSGSKITENDERVVMLREQLTYTDGFFAGVKVGDQIEINGIYFKVGGIYSSEADRNNVYMSISDAQYVLDLDDQVSSLNVYAETKSAVDLIIYDIQTLYQDISATSYADSMTRISDIRTQQQDEEIERLEADGIRTITNLEDDNEKIENTGNQIIIISLVTACLIVLFLMLYTVRERTKEIGILKALGFPGKNIMSQFIFEGIIIGILGGIIGITIGVVGGPMLAEYLLPASSSEAFATSTPSITLILMILGLTAALGAAGTIYPAWEASRKSPMEAMKHE